MNSRRNELAITNAYKNLLDSDAIGVFHATDDGEIMEANSVFLDTLGYSNKDLPLHVNDLTPAQYSALDESKRDEVHWTGSGLPWQKEYIRKDGSLVPVLVGVSLVDPRQGNCICFAMDISALQHHNEQVKDVCKEAFDDFDLIYCTVDSNGTIFGINTYGAKAFGYLQEELLGSTLNSLIRPEDREKQNNELSQALSDTEKLHTCELQAVCKDNKTIWLRQSLRGIKAGSNTSLAFIICADITSQKKAEEQLILYHNKVRTLTAKTVLAEEKERRDLAIGLHDRVGHRLAIAKLRASMLKSESFSNQFHSAISEICDEIDAAIDATRDLTSVLGSTTLYDLGLGPATETLAERISSYADFKTVVTWNEIPKSIPQNTSVIVLRVVRELLFNIVKHAKAKAVKIKMEVLNKYLHLEVVDDGIGIKVDQLQEVSDGFGLFSIHEQVREISGHFQIGEGNNGGTKAYVVVPI